MREPFVAQKKGPQSKSCRFFLCFLVAVCFILTLLKSHELHFEQSVAGMTLPTIIGACGVVLAGQSSCEMSCPASQRLTCTWSACGRSVACSEHHSKMQTRECFSDVVQEQTQCCTCQSVLKLRGGFSRSRLMGSNFALKKKPLTLKMTGTEYGQEGSWQFPEKMPDSFSLGNDEEWSLTTLMGQVLPEISEDAFMKTYIDSFSRLLNQDFMKASPGCNPYDPASWILLGAPLDVIRRGKLVLHQILQGWFGGHPTKVYSVGPGSLKEIPTQREGLIVISSGKANRIRDILDTSWWGDQWFELQEKQRVGPPGVPNYIPDYPPASVTGNEFFRVPPPLFSDDRESRAVPPPILCLLVHEDECSQYLSQFKDFPHDAFLVCHSGAGSGVVRNKALGILKEKYFTSGIIVDDDVQYIDSSKIRENRGFFRSSKPAENILEVMFDILSGDEDRAERWKSRSRGPFKPEDLIAPFEIIENMQGDSDFGKSPEIRFPVTSTWTETATTRHDLEDVMNFNKYRGFVGLSKFAIWTTSYRNSYLWEDAQDSFAKDFILLCESESRLSHTLLDIRIGRHGYPKPPNGKILREYWKWVTSQMSVHASSLEALDFDERNLEVGSQLMIEGKNEFSTPRVMYAALAIFQWTRLNIDEKKDPSFIHLWHVFDGLYRQKQTILWAQEYIARQDIASQHPFRDIYPAKLLALYNEGNWRYIEAAEGIELIPTDPKTAIDLGSSPYFDDRYENMDSIVE